MKKSLLLSTLSFLLLTLSLSLFNFVNAQTPPNAFNYSAVARNASGEALKQKSIGIQASIIKTTSTGAVQYKENHVVTTDDFGLFNLVIGAGAVQTGSMANIQWGNDNYYLSIAMDVNGGTNFLTMGTTQLLSVPYALYAKNGIDRVSGNGDTLYFSNGQKFLKGGTSTGGGAGGGLVAPVVSTLAVTNITSNSARLKANISNADNHEIMERGFVFSTRPKPTLADNTIEVGRGIGDLDTLTRLNGTRTIYFSSGTTYYVRAYATTENGINVYGNEVSFTTLSVGQTGQGGGIVFFDKGEFTDGWRYLEVAPTDQSTDAKWGCYGTEIGGTSGLVGTAKNNTNLIVSGCSETGIAAKIANDLNLGGKTDWYLPSIGDLSVMYNNLHKNNLGNFNTSANYWSSSEVSGNSAWSFYFDGGNAYIGLNKNYTYYVRAVRAF